MHVILAHEPPTYRSVLAAALRQLRPDLDVTVVDPAHLDSEVRRLAPDVVVCSRLTPLVEARVGTWVLLYPEYQRHIEVSVAGERSSVDDMDFDTILGLIDQTQQLRRLEVSVPSGGVTCNNDAFVS